MRPDDRGPTLERLVADAKTLARMINRQHPVRAGFTINEAELVVRMRNVHDWAGLGYPSGGNGAVRGGDATPLPERLGVALADQSLRDAFSADLVEAEDRLCRAATDLRWLTAFQGRHTPTKKDPNGDQTGTCDKDKGGCGRVVACTAADRLRSGLCDKCRKRRERAVPTPITSTVPTDRVYSVMLDLVPPTMGVEQAG